MRRFRPWLAMLALLMLILGNAIPAFAGTSAKANKFHAPHKAGTVQPMAGSNMTFHGGPVFTATTQMYAIYWGSNIPSGDKSLIQRFYADTNGTSYYHILNQYGGTPNTVQLAGTFTDTYSPGSLVYDTDIQSEVSYAMSVMGWTAGDNKQFVVFTENGTNICFDSTQTQCSFTTFCGYHSNFVSGGNVYYTAMPYLGMNLSACGTPYSPNGNANADSEINVASHEMFETSNDPQGNAWYDSAGSEIGDKCAWTWGSFYGNGADLLINGHYYIVQKEWSNANSGCVMTH